MADWTQLSQVKSDNGEQYVYVVWIGKQKQMGGSWERRPYEYWD